MKKISGVNMLNIKLDINKLFFDKIFFRQESVNGAFVRVEIMKKIMHYPTMLKLMLYSHFLMYCVLSSCFRLNMHLLTLNMNI